MGRKSPIPQSSRTHPSKLKGKRKTSGSGTPNPILASSPKATESEATLRDSEQRYRLLFEKNPQPLWIFDAETFAFLDVNEAAVASYGYSKEEFLSMTAKNIRPPEEIPFLLETAKNATADLKNVGIWHHRKRDGTFIDVEVVSSAVEFACRPACMAMAVDVTERRRADRERQAVFEIIEGVNKTANLAELLRLIHQSIRPIIYAENFFVALYNPGDQSFDFRFFVDQLNTPPRGIKAEKTCSAYVVRTGQPQLISDEVFRHMEERGEVELLGTMFSSWLGVPLKTPTETIGVLVVQHYTDLNAYSQRDVEFLSSVANPVALAIERKRTEDALRQSEERYRAFVQQSSEGIWRFESKQPIAIHLPVEEQIEIIYQNVYLAECNDAMAQMYGFSTAGELMGLGIENLLKPSDPQNVELLHEFILSGYRAIEAESIEYARDGSPRHFLNNFVGIVEEGCLVRVWGMQRDITSRKDSEEALRKSDERFQHLARATNDVVGDWNLLTHELWWNENIYTQFGYKPEEISNHIDAWFSRIHPDDQERIKTRIAGFIKGGQTTWQDEYRFRRADGSYACVLDRAHLILDKEGQPTRMIGAMTDVTERREVLVKLARLKSLYSILSRINEAIVREQEPERLYELACRIVVSEGLFKMAWVGLVEPGTLRVNPVAQWGSETDYLKGIVVSAADIPEGRGPMGTAIRENRHAVFNDFQNDPRISLWRERAIQSGYAACAAFPLRVASHPIGAIAFYEHEPNFFNDEVIRLLDALADDISFALDSIEKEKQRKRVEAALRDSEVRLRQAQKMEAIGRLAGGVAHDFNNLLTAITGYSDLLLLKLTDDLPLRHHAEEIKKASERAAALTQQLLAFSRKQVLQPRILDLNAVIADMDEMLHRLIGENIELVILKEPALRKTKADPGQVTQVLMNLVINSRDSMPQGGKIIIETSNFDVNAGFVTHHPGLKEGPYLVLAVSDTGCGMDADILSHLFEPFFTTKEKGKGTGLGLSTVYGIVKQSGGYIEVHSKVREGTTFRVYLPRFAGEANEAASRSLLPKTTRGNETLLLVEDEENVRTLVRQVLEMNGYTVLEAKDALHALELSRTYGGPIQLILTDVVMPMMGGRELAEKIVLLRPDIKVLYMSGHTDDAILHHGTLQSNMAFLQKPFTPSALANKIRAVLDADNCA